MMKLTSNTLSSRSRSAFRVFEPGSWYLKLKESVLICIRKRRKSATVQLTAMIMMMGTFLLFTTDPLGIISLEILIDDRWQLFCHELVLVYFRKIWHFTWSITQVNFS